VNLLIQSGLAPAIFFFMISAALSLPAVLRLGLDPDTPVIGRVTSLTEDVRKYMTVLTLVNFLVGMGDALFLWFLGGRLCLTVGDAGVVYGLYPLDWVHHCKEVKQEALQNVKSTWEKVGGTIRTDHGTKDADDEQSEG
jgi:hypothetical protein